MYFNKFSFLGIKELCEKYQDEILSLDNKDLKKVLESRRVRFIDPLGNFEYAYFGDFYFDGDVMMLITKEMEYNSFHKPGELSDTLWSTVPVIFAGVDTRYRDDHYQDIFTGDVVSYLGYTSYVRYLGESNIPGLAGDNCEILFETTNGMHKEGTVFSDIPLSMYEDYDIQSLHWPTSLFYPCGVKLEDVIERASRAMTNPYFENGNKPKRRGRQLIYRELSEVQRKSDLLCYFVRESYYNIDADYEDPQEVFADNFPDGYEGGYAIPMNHDDMLEDFWGAIKSSFHRFLLYAHQNPDKSFILCDFKKALSISPVAEQKMAFQFMDWYEYKLPNVILPDWILIKIVSWDMIGRD